jgi:hypothetical protein
VRARTWRDEAGAARRRFVVAGTEDGAVLNLVALRPASGASHGDELVAAEVAEPGGEDGATSFEEVRLSSIYGPDGLPRTGGAELYRPGEEWPLRLSGEAVAGGVLAAGASSIAITFFRWTFTGRPGWGSYEIEPGP